ncbi:uncharacterized protein ACWYII_016937 isoform 3-T3 [Salvelinus alpinus]
MLIRSMEEPLFFACGDFVDWSVQTAWEQNDAEVDSAFGDWSSACNGNKSDAVERSSSLSSPMDISKLSTKLENGNVKKSSVVFQECFQVLGESKETNCTVRSLSQLLENTQPFQPTATICDCGSLWSHLVAEPSRLRLSEPKPSLHCHSHSRMVSALRITPSNCISDQCESVFLEDHEETTETSCPPAAALIKTKLLAPSSCHGDTPAFLYQISQQWLTQCSIHLQPQHHKKPPALNFGEG